MTPPIHTLFISYDGMTDPLGQSQVIPYMQGLAKAGYSVTILSCEKANVYIERREGIQKMLDESGISWVALTYNKNPPVLSTLYDTWRLKQAAKKIHLKKNIQLVHTRSGTPALVGHWLKKKLGVRFLHDIRDFYADSRVDSGSWDQGSFLYRRVYRYLKNAEAKQLRNCDGVVCLTYAAEKVIKNSPEFDAGKPLAVIPCSVDLELFNSSHINVERRESLSQKLGIKKDDVVISYLGSIGGWYLVAEMMQFFTTLLKKEPKAKFLFISPHHHDIILQNALKYGIPEDRIVSIKGIRSEIPMLLSMSQYSIFFIKPCYSKQASSPTKHGELMALGIPVITNTGVGDLEMIINKYQGGIMIDSFTQDAYQNAVDKLRSIPFDKEIIRKGAEEFYALPQAIEKYCSMYKRLIGR